MVLKPPWRQSLENTHNFADLACFATLPPKCHGEDLKLPYCGLLPAAKYASPRPLMPRFPCPDPTLPSRLRANSDCPLTLSSRNMASPRLMMLPATANDEAVQLGTTALVSVLNDHVDIDPFLSSAPSVLSTRCCPLGLRLYTVRPSFVATTEHSGWHVQNTSLKIRCSPAIPIFFRKWTVLKQNPWETKLLNEPSRRIRTRLEMSSSSTTISSRRLATGRVRRDQ